VRFIRKVLVRLVRFLAILGYAINCEIAPHLYAYIRFLTETLPIPYRCGELLVRNYAFHFVAVLVAGLVSRTH